MAVRWPFYAAIAALACACAACFVAGSLEWGYRQVMAISDSAEAAEQGRFAFEVYAIGALELVALIAFFLRRSAWWLALGVQVGALALGVFEAARTGDGPGWFWISVLPVVTMVVLVAFRTAQPRPRRPFSPG